MDVIGRAAQALCLTLSLVACDAAAEVKDASPHGFTSENTRTVPVDAEVAWSALVGEVDRWWSKDHSWWGRESVLSIDPRAGGCFCERGADGRQAEHLRVVFVDPARTLRMTGGLGPLQGMGLDGALEWRLQPDPAGTRIVLSYRVGGYTPDDLGKFAPVVDRVLAQQLAGLADYLSSP